jgi:single-stranded-DNA-specific exonuclease
MKNWSVLGEYNGSDDVVDVLLELRGFETEAEKEAFLLPPPSLTFVKDFSAEFKRSLVKAKNIIEKAIEENVPIVVHGDYDADGICATAVLFNTLTNEKKYLNCFAFIPNRFDHGYGLSVKSIDAAVETLEASLGERPKEALFISVDSGITSVEEVDYIKSLGFKIIITDHHQKPADLPKADCIVWDDRVVGTGLSWLLSKTIGSKNPRSVALAALATVTDLQPLLGMNRSIVKEGLAVLNKRPPLGIQKLLEVAGRSGGEITTYDLGWVVGPRLNASGRIVDARDSLELLISPEERLVGEIARKLNQVNTERQDKTVEMYEVAEDFSEDAPPKVIISANEDYHEGVIGLVAAKLAQKYYRPSIVISLGDGYGKGSVRSIPKVDVISLLREHEDLFVNLGGHPMAAGFTIAKENIPVLKKRLTSYFNKLDDSLFEPVLNVDLKIPLGTVDTTLARKLDKLKPFGIGNKEPLFLSENVGVVGLTIVGKESNHLSLRLTDKGNYYKAIYFNGVEGNTDLRTGDRIDIVYKIKESEFNGVKRVELVIEDLKCLR